MRHLASVLTRSPPLRVWSSGDPVVGSRLLTPGHPPNPTFGSDVWDLSCLASRPNAPPFRLRFDALAPRWRRVAKEIIAQRINDPVRSLRERRHPRAVKPETCMRFLAHMKSAFEYMDREKIPSIPSLTQEDLDAYHAKVAPSEASAEWRAGRLKTFDLFRESTDYITGGGLGFVPFAGKSLGAIAGVEKRDECRTKAIPEAVMGPLLFWALAYVDTFASDIVAAETRRRRKLSHTLIEEAERRASAAGPGATGEEASRRGGATPAAWTSRAAGRSNDKRTEVYLAALEAAGMGVPAAIKSDGTIGVATGVVGACIGVRPDHFAGTASRGAAMIAASGLPLDPAFLGPAEARLPGAAREWRDPFTLRDLDAECRRLQTAAYIVVAYLSGMRDSEVQTLKRGCVTTARDENGRIYRHKLSGLAWKRRGKKAMERTWVVIEPVARAVAALEKLTAHLHARQGEAYLFAKLRHADDSMGLFRATINAELRAFARHCHEVLAPRQDGAMFPAFVEGGEKWALKPTQFRRTLAWHIANQPFGRVAGMIQYGHASIQMFEGYAGSPDSGFAIEVGKDRFQANLKDVVQMFEDDGQGVRPAGAMADELSAYFARARGEIGDFPGEVADAKRLPQLLRDKAGDLYPGPLVHCFFKPAAARCQSDVEVSERSEPLIGLCDPDCPNACWAQKHLPDWRKLGKELEGMAKTNSIPIRQKDILDRQIGTVARVVGALEMAERGRKA